MYKKSKIASDDEYLSRLDDILNRLRPLNPSISITGGEPTKSRRLVPILRLIEKYGYRKRTLTTNGSGLFDIVENKPILQHIADNHFQHSARPPFFFLLYHRGDVSTITKKDWK